MLNRWFLCFTFIGIIFACQHGACANRGEDTEKRTNSSDSDDSANVDVVIEITEKPKTYNATQNTLGIPDEGTNKSSEMACPNSWGNGNPKMEYTCPSTLCQHISYGCKTHCPADGDGYNCEINCKGLRHCLNVNDYYTPLPEVCSGIAEYHQYNEEPCPPLCMCIVLTVNFSDVFIAAASFSVNNSSFIVSGSNPEFQVSLRPSLIRYLVVTYITTLSDHFFRGLHSLMSLDVSKNGISSLSENLFSDLSKLKSLNLAQNRLSDLRSSVFSGLFNLKRLDLSFNEIVVLPSNLFSGLLKLNELDLSYNSVVNLPKHVFRGLSNLRDLILSHNEIEQLPEHVFSELSNLSYLELSFNDIEVIPDNIPDNVFWGLIANNRITVLPVFAKPTRLYGLDISNNEIETLPDNVFRNMSSLSYLYMEKNKISAIPDNVFSGLHALFNLYVSHNAIETLPDNVFSDLSALKLLDLKYNRISVISNNTFSGLYGLSTLFLSNNAIETLTDNVFSNLSALDKLYLQNNSISAISTNAFRGLQRLIVLDMSRNAIETLSDNVFRGLIGLQFLELDNNKLTSISDSAFNGLSAITFLDLYNNEIAVLSENAFSESSQLDLLDLSKNKIKVLPKNIFRGMTRRIFLKLNNNEIAFLPTLPSNVKILDISNNAIRNLPVGTFTNSSSLLMLSIIGNNLEITEDIFKDLDNLRYLLTNVPFMCCMKPESVSDDKCLAISSSGSDCLRSGTTCSFAKKDAISSCTDLISSDVLRVFLWIIGVCALLGNAVVIFYRLFLERDNIENTYSLFVLNLGVSDFLMGIYLLIIGIADAYYNDVYAWNDQKWRQSIFCTTAGTLSFISSEMSTFLILLVTIDRLIVIVLPLSHLPRWRISWKQAIFVSVFFWIVSITLAFIPIVSAQSYFKGEYYSQAGVCLALPLLGDDQPGSEYSFAVFVYLNSFIFGVIVLGQILILKTIRQKSRTIASSKSIQRERTVAKTLFLVVSTDFCCWFPVGVMGVLAKCGIKISDDAYAWVMVFVLPINAAVNPFLYTVTAIWRKRRREQNRSTSMTSTTRRQLRQSEVIAKETNGT
ncbi:relaxin receptor 1-like isoform X1 [Mizuhopecten yessoensis]|uniref:G-protein coupled receptor GRL101 n=1 Tax=Mizuhopecten yessoensis TaxID=6573 RepID=A0A210QIH0_MIZYE|nr:relaxin receptor 1-like isoform X1 [Mizuhopecten yessoensis]OWF48575.1 G-protein coupled receptor GRL101 [Mizuhopecten yessoensis]